MKKRFNFLSVTIIVFTIIFFLVYYAPIIFNHEFSLISDPLNYSYPLRSVVWAQLKAGKSIGWTPLLLSGYPILSMAQIGIGYPLTWGYAILPGAWAEQIYVIAPVFLASCFTYLYARGLKLNPCASLFGALSFAYGGMMTGGLSNGLLTNAVVWMPLILLCLVQSFEKPLPGTVGKIALLYALSLLTGVAQGFLFVAIVTAGYALWLGLVPKHRLNFRPFFAVICGMVCAIGIGAFQVIESLQASRLSVRNRLSYEQFSIYAYAPWQFFKVMLAPPYHTIEASPYLTAVTLCFAFFGILLVIRSARWDLLYWLCLAIISGLLILGDHTPLYRILYHVPVFNWFRGASRHSFEWTFSVSILAAFGWDYLAQKLESKNGRHKKRDLIYFIVWLALTTLTGIAWWRWTGKSIGKLETEGAYLIWKGIFTILALGLIGLSWRQVQTKNKQLCNLAAIFVCCFTEPFILQTWAWNQNNLIPSARVEAIAESTKVLQKFPPEQGRVYVRARLFSEQISTKPLLDAPNLTALHGLHNVAGYEPLILRRYSRALGDVWLDGITHLSENELPDEVWGDASHVLDLLNTRYVASYSFWNTSPVQSFLHEDIQISIADLPSTKWNKQRVSLRTPPFSANHIAIVSTLAHASGLTQGKVVAKIRVTTKDGKLVEKELRAGIDTAEWAHERSDVKPIVQHRLPRIFDRRYGDFAGTFFAYRYFAVLPLGTSLQVTGIEIERVLPEIDLLVSKVSLYNDITKTSCVAQFESETAKKLSQNNVRWQPLEVNDDYFIVKNTRALPRAWLVGKTELSKPNESLAMIQGKGQKAFDPRKVALVEPSRSLQPPILNHENLPPDAKAELTHYANNSLTVQTECSSDSFLVLSEINYPDWQVTIDGKPGVIYPTNYLLRGVFVPAGKHRVRMRYVPIGLKYGLPISVLSVVVVAGLCWFGRKRNQITLPAQNFSVKNDQNLSAVP